jgi:hypothetical protein
LSENATVALGKFAACDKINKLEPGSCHQSITAHLLLETKGQLVLGSEGPDI